MEYTETEKKILTMLFKICNEMIETCDGYLDLDCITFSRNDLFYLAEKLGIDY